MEHGLSYCCRLRFSTENFMACRSVTQCSICFTYPAGLEWPIKYAVLCRTVRYPSQIDASQYAIPFDEAYHHNCVSNVEGMGVQITIWGVCFVSKIYFTSQSAHSHSLHCNDHWSSALHMEGYMVPYVTCTICLIETHFICILQKCFLLVLFGWKHSLMRHSDFNLYSSFSTKHAR